MASYKGMDFNKELFITDREGKRVALKIEELNLDVLNPYPEIRGYLIGSISSINLKKETRIENVIFSDPATVVFWSDDTKTVVKCQEGDTYSKELGLAMCISKKFLGNKGNFNEEFKKWIPEEIEVCSDKKHILDHFRSWLTSAIEEGVTNGYNNPSNQREFGMYEAYSRVKMILEEIENKED